MSHNTKWKGLILLIPIAILPAWGGDKAGAPSSPSSVQGLLWSNPSDIVSRNLYFGPGGKQHSPHGPFTFVKEDMNGTNPKYVVHDAEGVKWTVKLGVEARPETAATRLVWALGYFTDEDYFLADMTIGGMPAHVHRGAKQIGAGGVVHNVRLKRHLEGREKAGDWKWRDNPFTGTRELDGLRVLMAVINNWDLKDVNNVVYREKHDAQSIYMVSDLGASFGSPRETFPISRSKGNLKKYEHSRFVRDTRNDSVSFGTPGVPSLIYAFDFPLYVERIRMRRVGRDIPREHARWMGAMLSRLSAGQVRDAFRAAGYRPDQVDAFTAVVERRISELNDLPVQ